MLYVFYVDSYEELNGYILSFFFEIAYKVVFIFNITKFMFLLISHHVHLNLFKNLRLLIFCWLLTIA